MRRKSLWKRALAVTLSATMLLSVPSEAVFADNQTDTVVLMEVTDLVETTEGTEEPETAAEAAEIVTEPEESAETEGTSETEEITETSTAEVEETTETEEVTEVPGTEVVETESSEDTEAVAEIGETEVIAETEEFEVTSEEKTATAAENFTYEDNDDGTITITGYTGSDTEVVIPEQIDGKSVTSIGYRAFSGCSLTSIEIPDSVTSIEEYAFEDCSSLTSIEIPAGVTSIGIGILADCRSLTSIVVDNRNTVYTSEESNCIIEKSTNTLIAGCSRTIIPNSVTSIGSRAFKGCSGLTSIEIPDSVTSIGQVAFSGCSSLTSIEIPDSVTSIEKYAFEDCSSLTSIEIPDSVTSIGSHAFEDCSSLISIEIQDSVTSIEGFAFSGCSSLTSIEIPEGVTKVGEYAFRGCSGLTRVTIPESVTAIDIYAFAICTSLTRITIPGSVKGIYRGAFFGCTGLTSCVISEGTTYLGYEAFGGCSKLRDIKIPDSVTTIEATGYYEADDEGDDDKIYQPTFYGCDNLTIYSSADSYARQFAIENNIPYKSLDEWRETICTHVNTEVRNAKSATCTETGYTGDTYCVDCGELIANGTTIAALGHSYTESIITQPTVTSEGVKTYTCSRCGDTYTETIAKLTCTHTNTEVRNAKSATCTEAGYTGDTYCIDCGELIANGTAIAALGHVYTGTITKQPTVTSEGVKTYTCSRCGDTYTETIAKLNCTHANTEVRNAKSATCTETGYTGDTYCVDCGTLISSGTTIAKLTITYTVKFDGNGASSGSMENQKITYASGKALSANKFKKKGYSFNGWNTKKDGSGTTYANKADGSKLTKTDGKTVTLYAQWTANKYTITFDGNGSTSGSMKKLSNRKYGKKYTLTKNSFKKKGYTFTGWNTKKDGSGKSYKNKAEVKNLTSKSGGKVTLYAQWKKTKYTITYNLNKGTNNKNNPSSYKITTKTIKLKNPTRKGYTFQGWYSDKKCTKKVTQIKKGSTGNITLYAKWKKK